MKLTYWIADIKSDSACYSVRERTRKAAAKARVERGVNLFEKPRKVEIQYANAFDLMKQLLSEGGAE